MAAKLDAVKVTLSTGKVAYLKTLKIADTEIAAQAVAKRADGDPNLLQIFMQKELFKNLLLGIDDKELTATDKEDLDALLTMAEYNQAMKVLQQLSGGSDAGKQPVLEVVNFGSKSLGSAATPA